MSTHHGVFAVGLAALFACQGEKPARMPTDNQAFPNPEPELSLANPTTPLTPNPAEGEPSDAKPGSGAIPTKPFYPGGPTDQDAHQAKTVSNLSDGEVFAIESAMNDGAVALGEQVKKQVSAGPVRDFATAMITHHTDSQNKAKLIAQRMKISASDDAVSNKLKTESSDISTDLKKKKGVDLDRAFIDAEVTMHREALDIVDDQLLPSVTSSELKDHLIVVRRHLADQLAKAEDIQSHVIEAKP